MRSCTPPRTTCTPAPRATWRLAVALALLGGAPAALGGEPDGPPPARATPKDPLTSLEAGVLPAADLVVIGQVRLLRVAGQGGPAVARVTVEKTLKGASEPEITLFAAGPRNTADPARPMDDYFEGRTAGRYVLFLKTAPNGSGYGLESLFRAEDAEGREKAAVLEREIVLYALPDPDERARRMVAVQLELVEGEMPWTRLHGAKELSALSISAPRAFPPAVLRQVVALRRRAFEEGVRSRLSRVIERLGTGDPGDGTAPPPRAPTPRPRAAPGSAAELCRVRQKLSTCLTAPARVAALSELAGVGGADASPDLLAALTKDAEATVRERAAVLLGDVGATEALPAALSAFASEKDPAVREAIVRAAGMLGDDAVVPWLVERLAEPAFVQPVAFALARVRTAAALSALDGVRDRAIRSVPPDDGLARLVEYLRTPAFAEAERLAGRSVGPRGAVEPTGPTPPAPVDKAPR